MRKEFYAEYYQIEDKHWWFIGRRQVFLRLLQRYLPARPDGQPRAILDVGCGTGTMLQHLSRFGQAQGIDVDEAALAFCRARGITQVCRSDGLPLPFPDGSFDLITALDVIEHIEDDQAMLGEIYRITRAGGLFLFSVPAYRFLWGPQDEISNHKRRYVATEIRARVTAAGYRIRRLSYFNTFLFPVIAGIRVVRPYRPGAPDLKSDFTMTRPGLLNTLLGGVFALEAPVVERVDLPFGVSLVGLAFKPQRTKD